MTPGLSLDGEQLELELVGAAPWDGRSARSLTKSYLRYVDKSRRLSEPARADEIFMDPAQWQLFLEGRSDGA